ncbi:acyl-CoA dehydrogenase family protein [Actinoplanes awajinensis]|uniref:Acyl-CoA dehydrogenase n=1 Tax=Actinoplanes awajinensis subsp. mycoplanecinus TaxID=135947 RepID=A0A0X3V9P9_9ACTN|nr:acyl-CoA dehydrogenase family protein [Actinoplanes awajinensis]KUL41495.1 acyl-CoA dehydrogenase [Actinoplanes awajinensis subsp. mycoplanecinus]
MGPDFALDDAQEAIVRLAGEVLSDHDSAPGRGLGSAPGRNHDNAPGRGLGGGPAGGHDGAAAGLWKSLGQAGLLGLAVPRELGGAGLGALETGLLLTEIGRHAAAVPAWSTLALGVLPVARWGTPAQQRDLLPGVLEGRVLTAALGGLHGTGPRDQGAPVPVADDGRLSGTCHDVPDADQAHRILIPVGERVVLVDPAAAGVTVRRTPGGFAVLLADVASEPLGDGKADIHRYAVSGAAALGDGALAGALRMTADHVRDRHQFGRPLATFQAVAQQIADVYVTSRTMHLAALAAGWGVDDGAEDDSDLWTAAYWMSSEVLPALRTCHHLHGGLGLAADYPLHRHTALVRELVRHLGGAEQCLDRLGGHGAHRSD